VPNWKGTWDKPSVRESFVVVGPMPAYLRPVFEHLKREQSKREPGSGSEQACASGSNKHHREAKGSGEE
jgi:hypothetical protein